MTWYEKIKGCSIEELADVICGNGSNCGSCPISVFDDIYMEPMCPAKSGEQIQALVGWLMSEV